MKATLSRHGPTTPRNCCARPFSWLSSVSRSSCVTTVAASATGDRRRRLRPLRCLLFRPPFSIRLRASVCKRASISMCRSTSPSFFVVLALTRRHHWWTRHRRRWRRRWRRRRGSLEPEGVAAARPGAPSLPYSFGSLRRRRLSPVTPPRARTRLREKLCLFLITKH